MFIFKFLFSLDLRLQHSGDGCCQSGLPSKPCSSVSAYMVHYVFCSRTGAATLSISTYFNGLGGAIRLSLQTGWVLVLETYDPCNTVAQAVWLLLSVRAGYFQCALCRDMRTSCDFSKSFMCNGLEVTPLLPSIQATSIMSKYMMAVIG